MKIFQEAMGAAREFFLISRIPKRFDILEILWDLEDIENLENLEDLGDLGDLEEFGAMAFRICFAALR